MNTHSIHSIQHSDFPSLSIWANWGKTGNDLKTKVCNHDYKIIWFIAIAAASVVFEFSTTIWNIKKHSRSGKYWLDEFATVAASVLFELNATITKIKKLYNNVEDWRD